jgi:four helix bundle protein
MEYDFEKLQVYQEAMNLTEKVYKETKDFPRDELYGVVSQIRRAVLSIGLNIAEGKGRFHTKVYVQFLYQARGSFYETIALVKMSQRLGYLSKDKEQEILTMMGNVGIKLNNLIKALQ